MNLDFTLSWVLAIVPEISLIVLLFFVLIYNRLFNPTSNRQVGVFTAWGAFVILLVTMGLWLS